MFQLSKKSEYGLQLVLALARQKKAKLVSVRRLSQISRVPYSFASHLASKLKTAGILASKEGIDGGYFLKKEPSSLTLAQIFTALEGKKGLVCCLSKKGCQLSSKCQTKPFWQHLQQDLFNLMNKYTLSRVQP